MISPLTSNDQTAWTQIPLRRRGRLNLAPRLRCRSSRTLLAQDQSPAAEQLQRGLMKQASSDMQLIGSLPALEARVHPFKGVRASHEALHPLDAQARERSTSTLPVLVDSVASGAAH